MAKKLASEKMTFSAFKDLREFEGLTQSQLARKMGIKQQCLASFENTRGLIAIKHLIGFWRAMEVDANVLLNELERDIYDAENK